VFKPKPAPYNHPFLESFLPLLRHMVAEEVCNGEEMPRMQEKIHDIQREIKVLQRRLRQKSRKSINKH